MTLQERTDKQFPGIRENNPELFEVLVKIERFNPKLPKHIPLKAPVHHGLELADRDKRLTGLATQVRVVKGEVKEAYAT